MHGFFKALRFIILFVSKCVNVKDLMSNLSCISTIFLVVGKFLWVLMFVFAIHKQRDITTLELNGDVGVSDKYGKLHVFDIKVFDFLLLVLVLFNIFFFWLIFKVSFLFNYRTKFSNWFHNDYINDIPPFIFVQINHLWCHGGA